MPTNSNILFGLKSYQDFADVEQQKALQQRQANTQEQMAQAQLMKFQNQGNDLKSIAQNAFYKKAAGMPVSPEEDRLAQAWDIQQQKFVPDGYGGFKQNPSVLGQLQPNTVGAMMQPPAPQATPPRANTVGGMMNPTLPTDLAAMDNSFNEPASALPPNPAAMPAPVNAPGINAPAWIENTPWGQKEKAKVAFKTAADLQKQANAPMTEGQGNAALFADRMMKANEVLDNLSAEQTNVKNRLADQLPLGNFAVSDNFQKASQAERDFINSILRKESGAAISPSEFDNARKQYFPQPGDKPEVIAQKKQNRLTAINGVARQAGTNYKPPETEGGKLQPMDYKDFFNANP